MTKTREKKEKDILDQMLDGIDFRVVGKTCGASQKSSHYRA